MSAQQPKTRTGATEAVATKHQQVETRGHSLPRIAPFAAYLAFIAIADLLGRLGWSAQQMLWLYPVKIVAVVALLIFYRRQYVELFAVRPALRDVAVAVGVGALVFVLWINLDAGWMQIGASAGYEPTTADGGIDWLLVVCRVAGAALVVPVMEELFWRSFLQRWLEKADFLHCAPAAVGVKALAITSVLFGFEHSLWFAGIVAGLAYGVLYMRAGNLWSPIVAHGVTNGMLAGWVLATGSWTYW
jgi:CAAX prenyl protease-like protein